MEAAEKGGYEHFMLKEIMEQPRALKATIEPRIKDGRIVLEELGLTDEELRDVNKIVITACGSASYAGQVGRYVIEELCRIPTQVEVASELRYRGPIVDSHTLLIAVSQSGETADTIAAIRECKEKGARTMAIVNVVGSTIAKLVDHVVYTWAGPEVAVATTKGYTTQVAILDMLAIYLADKLGRIDKERYDQLLGDLQEIPSKIQRAIDLNTHVQYLAENALSQSGHILYRPQPGLRLVHGGVAEAQGDIVYIRRGVPCRGAEAWYDSTYRVRLTCGGAGLL